MECISNIVGISRDPDCCTNIDTTTSKSGLWLDDLTAGSLPLKQAYWKEDEVQYVIPDAINQALQRVSVACEKRLIRHYGSANMKIGNKDDYTGYLPAADYYYLCIKGKNIRGLQFRLNSIDIFVQGGKHTGAIKIYQNGEVVYDGTVTDFVPTTYSLEDDLFITYAGARPRDFQHVSCCNKKPAYFGYISIGGGTTSDLSELVYTTSNYANGFYLDVTFDCFPFAFLCNVDFIHNPFGVVFAKLVQQIARYNIAYRIMSSDKVSAYSQIKSEELQLIMEYLTQDIESMVNYLPENLSQTDCYICNGVYKSDILI